MVVVNSQSYSHMNRPGAFLRTWSACKTSLAIVNGHMPNAELGGLEQLNFYRKEGSVANISSKSSR